MKIDIDSVKGKGAEHEVNLLKHIVDEINAFLKKAIANKELFSDEALLISDKKDASGLSTAISGAYRTILDKISSPNLKKIENTGNVASDAYLPLHGKNGYIYISNRVVGVADALQKSKTKPLVIAPHDVARYIPPNAKSEVKELEADQAGYTSMTYEQLVAWTKPHGDLIRQVVQSGGVILEKMTDIATADIGPHYFSIVAGCAEASRHLEFGVFTLMVVDLQKDSDDIWKTIIDAQETRAWPPMATNADGDMTQFKEGSKKITGSENVIIYFSRLARRAAKIEPHISMNGEQAQNLQGYLAKLVQNYLSGLLCQDHRLFLGRNQPIGKSGLLRNPLQPAEWVPAGEYSGKLANAVNAYKTYKE